MVKKTVVRAALAVWIVLWAIFLIRPLFVKNLLKEYSILLRLSSEGKRAYVAGPKLYELIKFSRPFLKPNTTYRLVGVDELSLEHRRVRYYLYPNIEDKNADFILVYDIKDFKETGYRIFKILDTDRYILKKVLL